MVENKDRFSFVCFVGSCLFFAFLLGFAVSKYRLRTYHRINSAFNTIGAVLKKEHVQLHHLSPARYERHGARILDPSAMSAGLTLLTSYWPEFDWKPGIRLIDAEGRVLHRWLVHAAKLWPTSPHKDQAAGAEVFDYIHGTHLFDNGDVLFNVENMGLVRMDKKGAPIWKLPYRTHHSIHRDESGNFWVCGSRWIDGSASASAEWPESFKGLNRPLSEDVALLVSPDG
jgi:hypothetical protein